MGRTCPRERHLALICPQLPVAQAARREIPGDDDYPRKRWVTTCSERPPDDFGYVIVLVQMAQHVQGTDDADKDTAAIDHKQAVDLETHHFVDHLPGGSVG